ncbi:MAG: hypothetical protein AAFW65_08810 [Pseudomonadota bacterium]
MPRTRYTAAFEPSVPHARMGPADEGIWPIWRTTVLTLGFCGLVWTGIFYAIFGG